MIDATDGNGNIAVIAKVGTANDAALGAAATTSHSGQRSRGVGMESDGQQACEVDRVPASEAAHWQRHARASPPSVKHITNVRTCIVVGRMVLPEMRKQRLCHAEIRRNRRDPA